MLIERKAKYIRNLSETAEPRTNLFLDLDLLKQTARADWPTINRALFHFQEK